MTHSSLVLVCAYPVLSLDHSCCCCCLPHCLLCVLQVADRLEAAVNIALDEGYRTKDIHTDGHKLVKCSEMGEVLLQAVA